MTGVPVIDPDVVAEDLIKCEDLGDCFRVTLRLGTSQNFPLRTCPKSRMAFVLRTKRALARAVANAGPNGDQIVMAALSLLARDYFQTRKTHRGNLNAVNIVMKMEQDAAQAILQELETRSGLTITGGRAKAEPRLEERRSSAA